MSDTDRNNQIAQHFRALADLFHGVAQGAGPATKTVGEHLAAAGIPTNQHTISAEQVDAMKSPEVAKADKATRKAKAAPAKPADAVLIAKEDPGLTPEQIAAEIKAKLVALVNKARAKAVAVLASVGAKNFSTIPVEKHPEVLLAITAALAACEDNDPLA